MFNLTRELQKMPIVAILRNVTTEDLPQLCDILVKEGVRLIEMTMNSENLEECFNVLRELQKGNSNLHIGAGTVITKKEALLAKSYGAQFFVTPNTNEGVLSYAREHNIPVLCGAITPSEIVNAYELGAEAVKLFPVGTLGISYIKEFFSALDSIPYVPTGAIEIEEIAEYKKLNAVGFGLGSKLVPKDLLEKKDFDGIRKNIKKYVEKVKEVYDI